MWEVEWLTYEEEEGYGLFDPRTEDLSHWLEDTGAAWSYEQKRTIAETVSPEKPRQQIRVSGRQFSVIQGEAVEALSIHNDPPCLFVRGGKLVRLANDEEGRPSIQLTSSTQVYERLSKVAEWVKLEPRKGMVDARPDEKVAKVIVESETKPFPALQGVVEVPVLRRGGTILDKPGYDEETSLYYAPSRGLRVHVPNKPSRQEVHGATALINEMIKEFPFVSDADKTNALACMLTPVLRPAIDGPVPLAAITAPMPGTGKGLLSWCFAYVPTGRAPSLASQPRDDNEWRKQLTSQLLAGNTFIIYDNVRAKLDSGELAKALTAGVWEDRVLGINQMANLRVRATWVANGNNLRMSREIARRSYLIEMDARSDHPERRTFTRNLEKWVPDNRGKLLSALLTLGRAWYADERPLYKTPVMGTFENWTTVVGSVIAHAGIPGFLENRDRIFTEMEDDETEDVEDFIERWHEIFGDEWKTLKQDVVPKLDQFGDALPSGLPRYDSQLPKKLAHVLRGQQNVTFANDLRIEKHPVRGKHGARWRVIGK